MRPDGSLLARDRAAQVEIVVPVRDEERDLEPSIRRLAAYLGARFPFRAVVTIADNGSTDRTWAVARALATELDGVRTVHLDQSGRGQRAGHRPGPVGAAVVGDRDHGAEREARAQVCRQAADAGPEVTLLVPDRDNDLHLRGAVVGEQ